MSLLTPDLGLVRARAEGLRNPGSKLVHALQTLSETEVVLLRGKEGWRLAGAVLVENWFTKLSREARLAAGRRASLILRLVQGETADTRLYDAFKSFLTALPQLDETDRDKAELSVTLSILSILGLDAGEMPDEDALLTLTDVERRELIERINRGITASGL